MAATAPYIIKIALPRSRFKVVKNARISHVSALRIAKEWAEDFVVVVERTTSYGCQIFTGGLGTNKQNLDLIPDPRWI